MQASFYDNVYDLGEKFLDIRKLFEHLSPRYGTEKSLNEIARILDEKKKKKKKGYETLKGEKIRKRVLEQCRGIQEEIHQYERWVKERVFNAGEITRVGGKARSKSIDLRCSDATRDYHLLISAVGETVIITPESRIRSQGEKKM